jgi:predicted MFS family arabinose efflux permease
MLMIINGSSLNVLYTAGGLVGTGEAFMYVSHLYYGVSRSTKRSGSMAIHEFLLSIGFVTGSFGGGLLSDHFGPYMPYWFGLSAIGVGIVLQILIWFGYKYRMAGQNVKSLI